LYFENCTWASGAAFQMANANDVFKEVLRANYTIVNSTSKWIIPLSVCICSSVKIHGNCYSPNLGSIFPGQTLNIQLIVPKQYLTKGDPSITLAVANTQDDECSILNSHHAIVTNTLESWMQ